MMNTEDALLPSARRMDKDALTKVFDLYASALYKYALRLCQDSIRADQVVGDVFAKLLEQLSVGQGPRTNLRCYLFQMAYHLIVDSVRRSYRSTSLDWADRHWRDRGSIHSEIENRIDIEKALDVLQSLSVDQRHIIVLRILEGFSVKETAAILGKTAVSVKVAQCRALEILRQAFILEMRYSAKSNEAELVGQ